MTRKIAIFDTTLRDGEQSPGASMNSEEKLVITRQLLRLNVDVIEASFPVSSPGDFKSVQQIAAEVGDRAVVCALSRAVEKDIDSAARALAECKRPRIHTGIGVSHSHIYDKLRTTPEKILERTTAAVKYAKKYVNDVSSMLKMLVAPIMSFSPKSLRLLLPLVQLSSTFLIPRDTPCPMSSVVVSSI